MQKGWVAKCDASPLGLFSFQSAKQNPNFFSRKYKDFLPLKTDAMIIKQMQKSSRYSSQKEFSSLCQNPKEKVFSNAC